MNAIYLTILFYGKDFSFSGISQQNGIAFLSVINISFYWNIFVYNYENIIKMTPDLKNNENFKNRLKSVIKNIFAFYGYLEICRSV